LGHGPHLLRKCSATGLQPVGRKGKSMDLRQRGVLKLAVGNGLENSWKVQKEKRRA